MKQERKIAKNTSINPVELPLMAGTMAVEHGFKANREVHEMQAYCVKCRQTRDMNGPRDETTKNNRPIIKGKCTTCGTGLNIIGKTIAQMG